MKLKVCGMKYHDNIEHVAALQPDYLGFIFHEKSLRNFGTNTMPQIPHTIKKTGVFVDAPFDDVIEKISIYNLQAVQLHGNESLEFCKNLKRHNNELEIIKAFSIDKDFNFDILKPYEAVCDYFLFDTKGKLPGGNGMTFDWTILNKYPSTKPFFLSGGIGLNEMENLISFMEKKAAKYCYGIDINSKFEIKPGLKDIDILKKFKDTLYHFE